WNVLLQSIVSPLHVFRREGDKGKEVASIVTVLATAVLGTVLLPIAYYLACRNRYELTLDAGGMLLALCVSVLSWIAVCLLFWALSKAFHNGLSFRQTASIWGLSYVPNFLCILLYGLLKVVPDLRISSGFAAYLVSAMFILLLVWKVIYYFMFLRFVMDTSLKEFLLTVAASAIVFSALIWAGASVGIQVPFI
ncbi:MAG: YIP1 family protein, partial [Petrimonas sp.]|nr:YIP1 family protein [Petrimonas sp.]